jgi:O-antigen ligase
VQWFFSTDRHHMPWHAKSLIVHLLFEQGLLGLGLAGLMVTAALWRCTVGHARNHPLAPALAGSLLGFVVVGLFDSLVDAPRVAFLFWCVCLLALGLRALPPPVAASGR